MFKTLSGFESWPEMKHELYGAYRAKVVTPIIRKIVKMAFCNPIKAQVVRDGEVVQTAYAYNDIVDQGMNSLLDVFFRNQTQIPIWYMGLINTSGASLSNSDTAATHTWTENTAWTGGGTRLSWTGALAAAATRSISNSTTLDFAFTTTENIHGIFIQSTSSGSTGTLWSTAPFSTDVTVNNGDTLKVTYTVSG